MERCPSGCRASEHHVSDGREADQGGDGQGRSAAPAAPTLGKVVCGHPLSTTDLLGCIIIFESLRSTAWPVTYRCYLCISSSRPWNSVPPNPGKPPYATSSIISAARTNAVRPVAGISQRPNWVRLSRKSMLQL